MQAPQIDRLLGLYRISRLKQVTRALAALGKPLVVEVCYVPTTMAPLRERRGFLLCASECPRPNRNNNTRKSQNREHVITKRNDVVNCDLHHTYSRLPSHIYY